MQKSVNGWDFMTLSEHACHEWFGGVKGESSGVSSTSLGVELPETPGPLIS